MLTIERIIESTPYGKSAPIKIVANDGNVYILKFRKDYLPGKDRSITSELIAYRLIEHFNLNIIEQKLKLIEIDDIAIEMAKKANLTQESRAYFLKSKGINIAIEFLEDCEKATVEKITNKSFKSKVKTIDNVLLNYDRSDDNTNILTNLRMESKYYAIDWGLSFDGAELYRDVKTGDINNSGKIMRYHNMNAVRGPEYIFRKLDEVYSLDEKEIEGIITEIVSEIPKEWETQKSLNYVVDIVSRRVQNPMIINKN